MRRLEPEEKMPKTAGYSGTPLARKLGIISGAQVLTIDAPAQYRELLVPLPDDVEVSDALGPSEADVIHLFAAERGMLERLLRALRKAMQPDAVVWVSWPKKAAKVPTDITEDTIREVALPLGLVDVKVCAVDATWSGLKLVIRRELRGKP